MIKQIKAWLKKQFCNHVECQHVRDIGGDEQMYHWVKGGGLARSEWRCLDCGELVYKKHRIND